MTTIKTYTCYKIYYKTEEKIVSQHDNDIIILC